MGKSKYDHYYDKLAKGKATCKKCGAVIQCPNYSTTGMKKHLQNKHNIKLSEDNTDDSDFVQTLQM